MEKVKGVLLNGRAYDKKDNQGKGLSINVLTNYGNLATGKVVNLYAGKSYVGDYDLTKFKPLEEINIEYEQEIGSQYPRLVNITKVDKK